jgi:1-deoxy-D-xylulose-5-phosphate reductoisomerase
MENIRLEDALKHPVWQMGNSITIGSACMSNKGLEILEGKELFNFPVDQIQVLIHPQAKIHGMVRLTDGSLIAHIGETSMAEPVRNALTYPEMEKNRDYDLAGEKLDFEKADYEKFPMLDLAYEAGRKGHFYQIAYTVANDVGIEYFLNRRLHFNEIGKGVRSVFNDLKPFPLNKLDDIFKAEEEIRLASHRIFKEKSI